MNTPSPDWFEGLLIAAAVAQLAVAVINLFLERMLGWAPELARVPLLLREVHRVHAWFISLTLAIFAGLTLRFAGEMATGANPALRWLAGAIGVFWIVRVGLQLFYYSASHWRGRIGRTMIHAGTLAVFGSMAAIYLATAATAAGP